MVELDSAEKTGLLLGWAITRVPESEIAKTIAKNRHYRVVELRNSERIAVLEEFPALSQEEAGLLAGFLSFFKETELSERACGGIEGFFADYCLANCFVIDREQKEYLCGLARLCSFGFGPLSALLECDSIEEIAVTGTGTGKPVRVFEKGFGKWLATNLCYCSRDAVKNTVNRMAKSIGRRITLQNPRLNAVLPDGSRLTASIEPVSFSGPSMTIRKFRKPFSPIELAANGTLSFEALGLLWIAVKSDCNILVAGNTGSGKTTLLNALFSFVPKGERVVVVEETPELNIMHEHVVKLSVVDGLNVGMTDLITDSLRMRPDRIVIGEVRSREEAGAFVDTMLAGQGKASYATFHAQNSGDAVNRLARMGVPESDLGAVDMIVVQKRWGTRRGDKTVEKRRVLEIFETGKTKTGQEAVPIMEFDYKRDRLEWRNEGLKVREKAERMFGRRMKLRKEAEKKAREFRKLAGVKVTGAWL